MNRNRTTQKGFSLVELLAVVLILSVLAAVAVPLYLNSRKTAAARTCNSNLSAISAAESAYATRFGKFDGAATADTTWAAAYTAGASGATPTGGLVGAPDGLASEPLCPLNGAHYTIAVAAAAGTTPSIATITCPNAAQHATDSGAPQSTWTNTLRGAGNDTANPF